MIDLSTTGVWLSTGGMTVAESAEFAARVESLGYSTLWLPEAAGRDPFAHIAHLANHTETLRFATGIANIYHRHPRVMKQAALTLAEQSQGRFLLGLGVSHAPMVEGPLSLEYSSPIALMRGYLDAMETSRTSLQADIEAPPVVLAALGPKMLALAAEKTEGAHPYLTTPEHTALAREILGPDKLLLVEQKVCLTSDGDAARDVARAKLGMYLKLPNYVNNWLRLGFTRDDVENMTDGFVDRVVVWGDEDDVREGVQAHYEAGATQVCVQPLHPDGSVDGVDWQLLESLAPAND